MRSAEGDGRGEARRGEVRDADALWSTRSSMRTSRDRAWERERERLGEEGDVEESDAEERVDVGSEAVERGERGTAGGVGFVGLRDIEGVSSGWGEDENIVALGLDEGKAMGGCRTNCLGQR